VTHLVKAWEVSGSLQTTMPQPFYGEHHFPLLSNMI